MNNIFERIKDWQIFVMGGIVLSFAIMIWYCAHSRIYKDSRIQDILECSSENDEKVKLTSSMTQHPRLTDRELSNLKFEPKIESTQSHSNVSSLHQSLGEVQASIWGLETATGGLVEVDENNVWN